MRKPRIKVRGTPAVYHCVSKIVGSAFLLKTREKKYLRKLIRCCSNFCCIEVITYCLMDNHFHILIRVPGQVVLTDTEILHRIRRLYGKNHTFYQTLREHLRQHGALPHDIRASMLARMGDLSSFMKEIKQRFSRWYNQQHDRFGTLWAERFRSVLVEDHSRHLRTVAQYIDLNPVRAGIVQDPGDYPFCGYTEAEAGDKQARKGLSSIYGDNKAWAEFSLVYREALRVQSAHSGHSDKACVDREVIRRKLKEKGALQTGEVLLLRIRHFTDGQVLGSRPFVDEVFLAFRDRFGPNRKSGARRPSALGKALEGLYVARDLKVSAVG